jgi:magnesium transporter
VLGYHALAVEDAEHFGQRPKLEDYDDLAYFVVYGAVHDRDDLVEVHCFYSERRLVTVRRDSCPAFAELRQEQARRRLPLDAPLRVLHRVIDALVDSFFPVLDSYDDLVDAIAEGIITLPEQDHMRRLYDANRRLGVVRRIVGPQRDLLGRIVNGMDLIPGGSEEARRLFRDTHDHTIRVSDRLDAVRELLVSTTELYQSTVSNRLNDVSRQLTLIATIFLPLTFLTGFFGQNFGWLVDAVGSETAFWALGIGLEIIAVGLLLVLFKRQRWA